MPPPADLPSQGPKTAAPEIELVTETGVVLTRWLSYSFNSHFLTPTDAWNFTLDPHDQDGEKLEADAVAPGRRVYLLLKGRTQGTGYIDEIAATADKSSGVVWSVSGRDLLSPAVDGYVTPERPQFAPTMTLLDAMIAVFGPYGFDTRAKYAPSNDLNRNLVTGGFGGFGGGPTAAEREQELGRLIRSAFNREAPEDKEDSDFDARQAMEASEFAQRCKPHPHEGAFGYAARVLQRFGLWIWLTGDGKQIVVGKPNFTQAPIYSLRRRYKGQENNILRGSVSRNIGEQPTVIIASGHGGGGAGKHCRIRAVMRNPAVDAPDTDAIVKEWKGKGAIEITSKYAGPKMTSHVGKPVFLHDQDARTQAQIEAFCRREMALKVQKSLATHYTVQGHEESGALWSVDTMATVIDEPAGVAEDLWVLSRTFVKSRSGGTTTELELIRPFSLEF